jgi:hypothetical protein
MLVSFTGALVSVIGAIGWAVAHARRAPSGRVPDQFSVEELNAIRERLAELEQRDLRVAEIEERLDFIERVLGRAEDAGQLRNPSEGR